MPKRSTQWANVKHLLAFGHVNIGMFTCMVVSSHSELITRLSQLFCPHTELDDVHFAYTDGLIAFTSKLLLPLIGLESRIR